MMSRKPVETSPCASAGRVMAFTAAARCSGVRSAVDWKKPLVRGSCCGPSSPRYSGSSGTSRARRSAVCTTPRSDSSSKRLVVADATFFPNAVVTVSVASYASPAVDTWLRAKRVLPCVALCRFTRASSAVVKARVRRAMASASSREMYLAGMSGLASGVDDVARGEGGRGGAVVDGFPLAGLPLAVEKRSADEVGAAAADGVHRVPELGGAHLVGDVL